MNSKLRLVLFLVFMITFLSLVSASEDTIDFSSILPGGGTTFPLSGTSHWTTGYKENYSLVTTYNMNGADDIVGLRCFGTGSTHGERASIQLLDICSSATLSIATIAFDQLLFQMRVRGNPDPTLGSSTIFGIIGVELESQYIYYGCYTCPITPGYSPAYQTALHYDTFSPIPGDFFPYIVWGRLSTWTWLTWRFSMIPQNFFKIGTLLIKYNSGNFASDGTGKGVPYTTEMQIDEVKLYGIRFH